MTYDWWQGFCDTGFEISKIKKMKNKIRSRAPASDFSEDRHEKHVIFVGPSDVT